jgi:surface polysaccharide O-acyltransferase-like enzyme
MSNSKRKSSIELLRVVGMFMVVAYHWQLHAAGDSIFRSQLNANQIFSFGIGSWGALGADIFFVISAYFLINSNTIKVHRLLNTIIKVSIYGTMVVIAAICFNVISFDAKSLIKSCLGVFAYQYWFITVYVVMYVLHPALNKIIKETSEKYFILLTLGLVCVTYCVGYVFGQGQFTGRLACGLTVYIIVGFLERNPKYNIFERFRLLGTIGSLIGIVMLEVLLSYLGNKTQNSLFFACIKKLQITDSILMLIAALFIFYLFKNMNMKSSSVINFCGKYVVGAYMLHGGASFIKDFLWDGFFKASLYYGKSFGIYAMYYLACVVGLLVVGILVEFIYVKVIENNLMKLYKKIKILENMS